MKNGTPHSRYFNDELGVPNFLLKTEQMFVIQRDVLYNTNMKKDMFAIKKNEDMYILYNTILFVESIVLCSYCK